MSTTLVCQVRLRSPIAVVSLYGTLDATSAAGCLVTLRDCIADAPTALLLDMAHLSVTFGRAFHQFTKLFEEVLAWPGTRIGLCSAGAATIAMFSDRAAGHRPDFYEDLDSAIAAAIEYPVAARRMIALPPEAGSPALAREFALRTCEDWRATRHAKLATLIASELVTNAVVHARTPSVMALQLRPTALNISVRDGDPRPMFRPAPETGGDRDGDHGRGLLILDSMADAWGCVPTATGKVVWAAIDLPGSG